MSGTVDAEDLIGAMVFDRADDRIGEIRQVYRDTRSEQPTWVGVRIGLRGTEVLVPLQDADWDETALHASITRADARTAPHMDLEEPLSEQEEQRLLRHYGIPRVCTPREDVDLDALADAADSYSIHDADARELLAAR